MFMAPKFKSLTRFWVNYAFKNKVYTDYWSIYWDVYIGYPNIYVIYSNHFDNILSQEILNKEVLLENPISPIRKLII